MKAWLRWLAISVFVLSSTLNYLDRQLLAALAPTLKANFHLSNQQYGLILSVFSIVYCLVAPLAGVFVDRVGLNIGVSISVALWSLASALTGFAQSFRSLLFYRTVLGVAEAAGLPCNGKANGLYFEARDLGFATAFNQVGISVGAISAPLIVAALARAGYGWQAPFVFCGILGFIWIPVWLLTSKLIPPRKREAAAKASVPQKTMKELLRDRRVWGLAISTVFIMALYTLWTNWTTLYFVNEWHMTQQDANSSYAWIPPVFATLGGFFGGWLAYHFIGRGTGVVQARLKVCWISAVVLLATATVPLMPSRMMAAIAIGMSFFFSVTISTNLYSLPIDLFGPGRAAFGVSVLTCAYGLMQAFLSPAIGGIVDHVGFTTVCVAGSALPLIGVWILQIMTR